MLTHIVLFNIPGESENKNQIIKTLKDKLESLKNKIPQLKKLETGINISNRPNAYNLALIAEFETSEDLEVYRNHPDHQAVITYIREIAIDTVVVDFLK